MKAISVQQPWAWLIVNGYKPVENRTWASRFRGRVLIHAEQRWGSEQLADLLFVRRAFPEITLPRVFPRGGIVGSATIVDCVTEMDGPWFRGPHGFVLRDARAYPALIPVKGALGLFDVPAALVQEYER